MPKTIQAIGLVMTFGSLFSLFAAMAVAGTPIGAGLGPVAACLAIAVVVGLLVFAAGRIAEAFDKP